MPTKSKQKGEVVETKITHKEWLFSVKRTD